MSDEEPDRITLSPQVWDILNDTSVPADVFGAIAAFLVELRKDPVPQDALPIPGRREWYSAPLVRDLGLVEYHVGDTRLAGPTRILGRTSSSHVFSAPMYRTSRDSGQEGEAPDHVRGSDRVPE